MKSGNEKRPDTMLRQMFVLAGAAILLQGCAGYFVKMAHLKDNPMDQAIATGDEGVHMKETRDRLLKRFPIGQPVAPVKRYLESVGARCRETSGANVKVTCRYSQNMDIVFRTPIGDFPEIRSIYNFRIVLLAQQGRLRDVRVCRRITVIWFNDTKSDGRKRVEYPVKCLKGQARREGA